ncbi:hypothetical protein BsWGS_09819 [Bradybaena similaris]
MAGGHRSTLKQNNKSHNQGKHRSKRTMKRQSQGRVNVKQMTKDKKVKDSLRQETRQRRTDGRSQLLEDRRATTCSPPRLVVVISLDSHVDMEAAMELLKEADLSSQTHMSAENIWHVSACQWKKRMCFLAAQMGDLQAVLDAAKVADVILFLFGESGIDRYGEHCLTCVMGQGIPSHVFACQGLSNLSKQELLNARKAIDKVEKRFPGHKVRCVDTWQDAQAVWRHLANLAQQKVHYRDSRPYLLAESVEFVADTLAQQAEVGTLKVSGYLRGKNLNVNQLVHLPGLGDFQMSQINETNDPYPLVVRGNKDRRHNKSKLINEEMLEEQPRTYVIAKATHPEALQSEVVLDSMDEDQTWPTAEELADQKLVKVRALKGVSDYQGQWILDVDAAGEVVEEEDDDGDDESFAEMTVQADGICPDRHQSGDDDEEDMVDDTHTELDEDNYDEQIDMDEENKMYERLKQERQHVQFPDEVDTPQNVPARIRFARYRGLDSLQATPWDPNESLPREYARIYRVGKQHYQRLKKLSMRSTSQVEETNDVAEPGSFITVYVRDVPKSFIDTRSQGSPVTLFGLFINEQKMTLISTAITRAAGFTAPVKSKDPLIFQIGFRRFSASPVFSEHAYHNKFKMERFLPQSGFLVASMYAPIMFAPAPVLVFRENVVEDVEYYKPVELRTKWGKRGHIRQALGTHGHMKCTFNGQLRSEDTITMSLYKRVFPHWSFNSHVRVLPPHIESLGQEDKEAQAFDMFDS